MKTIEEVIVYCEKQAKEFQETWDTYPDHNESSAWYLEPVAEAYQDVIHYIKTGIGRD